MSCSFTAALQPAQMLLWYVISFEFFYWGVGMTFQGLMFALSLRTLTWREIEARGVMPGSRNGMCSVAVNNRLIITAGLGDDGHTMFPLDHAYIFSAGVWEPFYSFVKFRKSHLLTLFRHRGMDKTNNWRRDCLSPNGSVLRTSVTKTWRRAFTCKLGGSICHFI